MRIQHLFMVQRQHEQRLFVFGKDDCDWCGNILSSISCHYFNRDQRFGEKVFCANCVQLVDGAYKSFGQPEWRWATHVIELPRGAIPILSPTELTYSKTIQEAMLQRHDGVQVIDRTKWAGRDLQLDGTEVIGKGVEQLDKEFVVMRLLE